MASGIIELNNSGQTAAGGYLMGKIEWTGQPDTAGNLSSVTIRLYAKKASTTGTITTPTTGNWGCALTVDGETFAQNVYAGITADWVLLMEKTRSVAHDSDGSKSIPIAASVTAPDGTVYAGKVTQGSGTAVLDIIPRASSLSCAGSMEMGQRYNLEITAASNGFSHDLVLTWGGVYYPIASQVHGTVQWEPNIDVLAPVIPNAASAGGTITLHTYNCFASNPNDRTLIGSKSYPVTLSVPSSAAPDVADGWAKAACYNAGTAAASIDAFVQGYSKAQVTFDSGKITTKYGATVKGYKIVCGGVTDTESPYLTGVLTGTSATITCTVEDSRGFTASGTLKVGLNPYKKPALSGVSLYRSDADGTANRAGLCIYARATLTWSGIGGKNSCTMTGFYRLQGGSYPSTGTAMTSGSGKILTTAAAVTSTYVAKITAVDSLGNEASYEATIPTDNIAFHLREGGQGAAFGKYSEQDDLLDVGWNLRARKKLTADGDGTFGGSLSASGDASVGGNLSAGKSLSSGTGVELGRSASGHGGYLDFHFNGSTGDFTSRIIESASGVLELNAGKTVTLGEISNPTDVLKTLLNPTNFGYITDFNTGKAALPGLWRVYNADGSAAHAPYSGAVSGVCLVVVVYTSDGTMDKAHQLFLDGLGDVYYKVYNYGVSYGAWKKLTN